MATSKLVVATAAITAIVRLRERRRPKHRKPLAERNTIHPGGPYKAWRLSEKLLVGSNIMFEHLFRMNQQEFLHLVSWLRINCNLEDTKYQTAEQKVMFALYIFAHNTTIRVTCHEFLVTWSSVSRSMNMLLPMFEALHKAVCRQMPDEWLDREIELDPKLNAFNGCIGAIDGTHVFAHIRATEQKNWRDRRGNVSQNVLAAVRYCDGGFSYVLAGAEGSITDSTLASLALQGMHSFKIPPHRYYLGDSGFGIRGGLVIPFANVCYHLQDWRDADNPPKDACELYNLRHARLRVIVEQAFGRVKRRWKIVRGTAAEYSLDKQISIVYAVTGLHNFLLKERKQSKKDLLLQNYQWAVLEDDELDLAAIEAEEERILGLARERAARLIGFDDQVTGELKGGVGAYRVRHTAAILMWEQYQQENRRRHR